MTLSKKNDAVNEKTHYGSSVKAQGTHQYPQHQCPSAL